ncbi:Uncharacterized conserved protein YjiS, DUF1127 family [Thalassovita taeanensis]|uniref:Uncharacterized conserved protein YjiS, DUF1127 family n=2 Tax=Thalassovita taeanensis TaxID=657014 RepID=A0A1H9G4X2_9RHOB|nr:Uncharacterized conserved protein YjiS, DUF1127 family [Thalassovita taeanensis]
MSSMITTRAALSHSCKPSLIQRTFALLSLYRQRSALAEMDDARLADIGLSYRQALREARRPLWDVPHNWRG